MSINSAILRKEVQEFIFNFDPTQKNIDGLLFKKISPFIDLSISDLVQQIQARQKAFQKLPIWYEQKGILFPKDLNLQQTSSQTTAMYKMSIIGENKTVCDLSGGFGVDSYFLAKQTDDFTYVEQSFELCDIVRHNFNKLGSTNVTVVCSDGIEALKALPKQNWIYVDPCRRDQDNNKLVQFEYCSPNIIKHLDLLSSKADKILIKASPLIDINQSICDLSGVCRVYIIAVKNEVKEVLFEVDTSLINQDQYVEVITQNIINRTGNPTQQQEKTQRFSFFRKENWTDAPLLDNDFDLSTTVNYLYQPNAAVRKSQGFQTLCDKFSLKKLHVNTQLFLSDALYKDFPGRVFVIEKCVDFSKRNKKEFKGKQCNLLVLNFPLTTQQFKTKFQIKDGGNLYVFVTTVHQNKKRIFYCRKL